MTFFRRKGNNGCIILVRLLNDVREYVYINGNQVYTSDNKNDADTFDSIGQAHAVITEHTVWFQTQTLDYQVLDV